MKASPEAVTKALLSGALQKANDAVHADQIQDLDYALNAYKASCDLLAQVLGRTDAGSDDWNRIKSIVAHLRPTEHEVANRLSRMDITDYGLRAKRTDYIAEDSTKE
ncbi:MAG: hypothetical protein Q9163_005091 [Psora crenata]